MVVDRDYAWDPMSPIRSKIKRETSDLPGRMRTAREEVEKRVGPLTLGERMLLYQCLRESAEGLQRVTRFLDLFDLDNEAVARFWHRYKGMYS